MMQNRRILIVDDEPAFIRLLKINLERTGRYRVREVNDATQALGAAAEFRPDLILLDLIMPKLHGSDVADSVRADPTLSKTPIVFLTASAWKSNGQPNQRIAGCTVLSKPASMTEVITAIEDNLPSNLEAEDAAEAGEALETPKTASFGWFQRFRRRGLDFFRDFAVRRRLARAMGPERSRDSREAADDSSHRRGASADLSGNQRRRNSRAPAGQMLAPP